MRYSLLIYLDQTRFAALPAAEQNAVHQACGAWHDELVRSGHARTCLGLQPTTTATTVRETSGKLVLTDGPFAETREVLGGLESLECRDLDEALAIARRFPGLRDGHCSIEVRPEVPGGKCEA